MKQYFGTDGIRGIPNETLNKDLVSKIAADIKSLKPVEPYKGKGIKEKGEFILRKEGKKK